MKEYYASYPNKEVLSKGLNLLKGRNLTDKELLKEALEFVIPSHEGNRAEKIKELQIELGRYVGISDAVEKHLDFLDIVNNVSKPYIKSGVEQIEICKKVIPSIEGSKSLDFITALTLFLLVKSANKY